MFCPNCGVKEDQLIQFCRACGTDLRAVRDHLAQPDLTTASIANAREEIARAAAAKIKEGQWWQVGAIVPEVEKLFESPEERRLRLFRADEERRLRRVRAGVITSSVGLGMSIFFFMMGLAEPDALMLLGPSLLVLMVGLAVVINGLRFTVPKNSSQARVPGGWQQDALEDSPGAETKGDLAAARPSFLPPFVTEQTTRNLSSESSNQKR